MSARYHSSCRAGVRYAVFRKGRSSAGFTFLEMIVSLGILAMFMAASTDAVFVTMRALAPREAVAQLLQDTRDISTLLQESVEKAGAGELFDRKGRESTFGAAIIPRKVTGTEYGKVNATSITSDGGVTESDEITLAGTFPITGIVANDNGAGLIQMTFVPISRHSSETETVSYRHFAYQFFNRLYSPRERSYYYPSMDPNAAGRLLLVRSFGIGTPSVGRYRMVRITDVVPSTVEELAVNVSYKIEPELPFNRWIMELESTGKSVALYGSTDPLSNQYMGLSLGCSGATDLNGIITGGAVTQTGLATASAQRNSQCSAAALAYLHTYFIRRDGSSMPVLARYDYEGSEFPDDETGFTVLADGVEDMQIEYFLDSDSSSQVPEPGASGVTGLSPIQIDPNYAEPSTALITAINFSFIIARDTGQEVHGAPYPQLSNRVADLATYANAEYMTRMPLTTTFALKSSRTQQLFGQLN